MRYCFIIDFLCKISISTVLYAHILMYYAAYRSYMDVYTVITLAERTLSC